MVHEKYIKYYIWISIFGDQMHTHIVYVASNLIFMLLSIFYDCAMYVLLLDSFLLSQYD